MQNVVRLIVIALAFVAALSGPSLAQGGPYGAGGAQGGGPNPFFMQMRNQLGITDAQALQLQPIMMEFRNSQQKRTQATLAKIKPILTPAQRTAFDRKVAEITARGGPGGMGPDLFKGLGLTPDQQRRCGEVMKEMVSGREADRNALFAKTSKVLTAAQQAKFKAFLSQQQQGGPGSQGPMQGH